MSGKTEQITMTGVQLFNWEPYLTTVGSKEQFKEKLSEGYTVLRGVAVNTGVIQYGMSNQVVMCINVKPDTQYFFGGYKKSNIVFLNDSLDVVGNSAGTTFLTTEDTAYIVMYIFNYAQGPNLQSYTLSEIEEMNIIGYGSVVKPYEPYTGGKPIPSPDYPQPIEVMPQGIITVDFTDGTNHQTVELNCPREFTKWDRLQKIDGVWNWAFRSKRRILTGNGDEKWRETAYKGKKMIISDMESGLRVGGLCEEIPIERTNNEVTGGIPVIRFGNGNNDLTVFNTNKIIESEQTWEEFLAMNNLHIIYKANVSELIPLPQPEQDKLNAITMYAPNTEITNTGGCNMELTYTVDTKSYVDAKIAEVSTAIIQKGIG